MDEMTKTTWIGRIYDQLGYLLGSYLYREKTTVNSGANHAVIYGGTHRAMYTRTDRSAKARIEYARGSASCNGRTATGRTYGLFTGNVGRETPGKPVGDAQNCA